jgi:hypothetical protein
MHVFGSPCYAFIQNPKKLDARSRKGIFVGYDKDSPAYLVYYPETKQVERVCCMKFIDNFQIDQSRNDSDLTFPVGKPSETIAKEPKIKELPCIAESKQDNAPSADITLDIEQVHDNTNMPEEKSPEERYPARTRNKPNFYGQDKIDDTLDHTTDYCYKLANIPSDYQQAMESPEANKWQEAMDSEMTALIDNDT